MTSRSSQFSAHNTRLAFDDFDGGEQAQRRVRILAELDIDLWTQRLALPEASPTGLDRQPPASGPAAARALLAESANSAKLATVERDPRLVGRDGSVAVTGEITDEAVDAVVDRVGGTADAALDLLCVTGPHGLLLVPQRGLSQEARRLLKDILSSAMRVIENRLAATRQIDTPAKSTRTRLQSLRFTWPSVVPGEEGEEGEEHRAAVAAEPPTSDTVRALRGFLQRQLQGKPDPVLLYVDSQDVDSQVEDHVKGGEASNLAQLLAQVELPIALERRILVEAPELLMSDSALKRTLWRTLSAL